VCLHPCIIKLYGDAVVLFCWQSPDILSMFQGALYEVITLKVSYDLDDVVIAYFTPMRRMRICFTDFFSCFLFFFLFFRPSQRYQTTVLGNG